MFYEVCQTQKIFRTYISKSEIRKIQQMLRRHTYLYYVDRQGGRGVSQMSTLLNSPVEFLFTRAEDSVECIFLILKCAYLTTVLNREKGIRNEPA